MNNPDHYFYINWEDEQKNLYRVGILAQIDNIFYLKTYKKKTDDERDAYSHGYIGIPGFIPGELYKSNNQIFDFFLKRIYVNPSSQKSINYFEELKKSNGKTLTDSFSIEEMPESFKQKCKEIILALDRNQQKLKHIKSKKGLEIH